MMDKQDLIVAIYARVSSEQQASAGTIESQVEALKQRVTQDGLSVDAELCCIDEGYSGATLVRPGLERLRDLAAAGAIDRLYVHSPDRLARKYAYQVLLVDEFHHCGVDLIFLNQELGRTPEEDLLLQVQGMIAEYERAKILERSRRGKRHAARQGSINVLGGAPYGYRYVSRNEGGGQADYQIVLEEARVVRQVFEWVGQDRLSLGEVCRRLQKQGVPTRTGKPYWGRSTIWGMLKNPAYKGTAAFGKTQEGPWKPPLRAQRGRPEQPKRASAPYDVPSEEWIYIPVPALVSEALFDTVQDQLAENRQRQRQRTRGARHLLQGLLVCKKCGYAFYGKSVIRKTVKGKTRKYVYYRCIGTEAYRFGGQRMCDNKQVRSDLLEQAVWEDLTALLAHPDRLEKEYNRRLAESPKGVGWQSLEQLQTRIQKLKRGIARLVDAYAEDLIDKDEFEPRIRQARQRLQKLLNQEQAQADEETEYNELKLVIGGLQEFKDRVQEGLQDADWSARRQIIRTLVKQVEVEQEEVRIVYRVTPPPFVDPPDKGGLQDCLRRSPTMAGHTCT